MNWGIVSWVLGVLLTIYGIRFVFMAVKTLLSKEMMEAVIDKAGKSVTRTNKKFKKYLKEKVDKKKTVNKPMVTIR